jgi:serine/threonine-protein kinase
LTDSIANILDVTGPEVTLEGGNGSRIWSRLLHVYDADGTSSVFAIAQDGSFSRFSSLHSPLMVLIDVSRTDDGLEDEVALDFESPHAVDHFLLGPRIGVGGMAVVHEALLPGDEHRYAVKLCRPTGSSEADLIFALETAVMGALNHGNIVPLVASGAVAGGLRWLAMPCVPGQTLRRLLDRSRSVQARDRESLLRSVLLPVFLQVCDAVEHAHGLGVLHCDLKPGNVMVTPEGHAWLFDWGMAKTFRWGDSPPGPHSVPPLRLTQVGGTPGYMAPEQILGRSGRLGPWTDVWSLGAVLYELITGRRAFRRGGRDTLQFFRRILDRPPTRPDLRVWLPPSVVALSKVCRWAMAAQPGVRPGSVGELADEVRAVIADVDRRASRGT